MADLSALPIYMQAVALMVAVVLVVAILGRLKYALLALAGMVFVSSIGVATTWTGVEIRTWMYPLQASRSTFFLGFGVILFVAAVGRSTSMSGRGFRGQGLVLLFVGLYAGILRMVHESVVSGLQTIAFVLLTIVPILLVVQAVLEQEEDSLPLVRAIMLVNIAWIVGVAVQVVLQPGILAGGKGARFVGFSPNPQNAGLTLAVVATFALWLLLNDPKRHLRPLWIALFGVDVMLIIVTGSRTAAGTFLVGAMIATYGRLGRIILTLPLLLIVLYAALYLGSAVFVELGETAQRLRSLEDTRSGAWLLMLQDGKEHPWIGVGVYETKSENSYLKAFASYGVGMVALVLLLVGVSARLMWRLYRLRRWLDPPRRAEVDLVLAYNGMYFAASMLEGIVIARVAFHMTMMLIFSVIAVEVLKRETERIAWEGDVVDEVAAGEYGEESAAYLEVESGGR